MLGKGIPVILDRFLPLSPGKAHEAANISGYEMEIIKNLVAQHLLVLAPEKDQEKLLRYISLEGGFKGFGGE